MVNHRGPEFSDLLKEAADALRRLFGTSGDAVILTGSGTAAMEAAVANLVSPGERVVVVSGGKFGERWAEIVPAYGAQAHVVQHPYGTAADPAALDEALASTKAAVAFVTQNESSTGVLNDVRALAEAARSHGALLAVDAVSGLGGAPLPMDEWGVDVVVAGSQKCLMLPPGLSFVAASPRAWERMEASGSPRYYLDLPAHRRALAKAQTPYTPAVSIIFGLEESLRLIEAEGLEAIFSRHRLMRDMVRSGVKAMGLELFVADETAASPTVTAVSGGDGFDAEALRKAAARRGVVLGGGQGELKGRIFRIGHMGYAGPLDMIAALAAVELALQEMGEPVRLGAGLAAAQEVWAAW